MVGTLAAASIAGILGSVSDDSNPVWVLPVIVSGMACFLGLLATSAWSMRALTAQLERPRVGSGIYLTCIVLTGGVVAWLNDTPPLAYEIPFVMGGFFGAMTLWGGVRRRSRSAQRERLRSGARVTGTVTDDGLAEFGQTPNLKVAAITVSFPDYTGATRWVTVSALQSPARPISVGQQVDVWFDASAPGNTAKIVVEHDNGASRIIPGRVKLPAATPGTVDPQRLSPK